MDENPYEPPQSEPRQTGVARHGVAAAVLAAMAIVGTIVFSPADPISMVLVGPIVAGALIGAYLLGVWSGRRG